MTWPMLSVIMIFLPEGARTNQCVNAFARFKSWSAQRELQPMSSTLKLIREEKILTEEQIDEILDPAALTGLDKKSNR